MSPSQGHAFHYICKALLPQSKVFTDAGDQEVGIFGGVLTLPAFPNLAFHFQYDQVARLMTIFPRIVLLPFIF